MFSRFSNLLAHLYLALVLCLSAMAGNAANASELQIKLGQSRTITLTDPKGQRTRIHFRFSKISNGVMLVVNSSSKFMLTYDATICLTKRNHCEKTSTLPVRAGPTFEAWPPGGDLLILSEFTFSGS